MSIAVKFGDLLDPKQLSGFIYLDAVTSYAKSFGGRITEHPVETGVSISDHYISENPKFRVNGVISGVDLSPIPSTFFLDDQNPLNANPPAPPITISDSGSSLKKFLPDVVTQFLPKTSLTVSGDVIRQDHKQEVETLLETIMNGLYYNEDRKRQENRMTLSTLYEMDGNLISKSYTNCVLTGYDVKEEVDSGDALFLELTFEQVRFATSDVAEAPKPVKKTPVARGTAKSKDKGTVPTNTSSATVPKNDRAFSTD
jgi:hypothetical protein